MPANLSLRIVRPEDDILLLGLFASAREKELELVNWRNDQRRTFLETQFRAQQNHYRKHFPHRDHHIVMCNGKPVGMTDIARSDEEIRILDIIILTEHRNAGIGTELMQGLMAEADHHGKMMRLYVERFNPAFRLYKRLGFTITEDTGVYCLMERPPVMEQKSCDNLKCKGVSNE